MSTSSSKKPSQQEQQPTLSSVTSVEGSTISVNTWDEFGAAIAHDAFKAANCILVDGQALTGQLSRNELIGSLTMLTENGALQVNINMRKLACDAYKIDGLLPNGELLAKVVAAQKEKKGDGAMIAPLLKLLEDPNVLKVGYDMRGLADALKHQFGAALKPALDLVVVASMRDGSLDWCTNRRRRGVMRLPPLQRITTSLCIFDRPTKLHSVADAKACYLFQMPGEFVVEVANASGRFLALTTDAAEPRCHNYLPYGVIEPLEGVETFVCPSCKNAAPAVTMCQQPQQGSVSGGICPICRELNLPCENFKRGYCSNPNCSYRHERVQCPVGDACREQVLGACPFLHPSDNSHQFRSASTGAHNNAATAATTTIAMSSSTSRSSAAAAAKKVGPEGMAKRVVESILIKSHQHTQMAPPAAATDSEGAAHGGSRSASPTGRDLTATTSPFHGVPCRYFFGGGCTKQQCPFSHARIPLYIPVPVQVPASKRYDQQGLTPCPRYLVKGHCKQHGCPFLHLPESMQQQQQRSNSGRANSSGHKRGASSSNNKKKDTQRAREKDSAKASNKKPRATSNGSSKAIAAKA